MLKWSFSRLRITLLVAAVGFCLSCSFIYSYSRKHVFNRHSFKRKDNNGTLKYILYWNPEFNAKFTRDPYKSFNCEYNQCTVLTNREAIDQADAVIFSGQYLNHVPEKILGQIWIFTTAESVGNFPNRFNQPQFKNVFNWTWTYRRDSDILRLYGKIVPITNQTWKEKKTRSKRGDILWFVSNCNTPSKRHLYVAKMQKLISVDIYGKCGTKKCARGSLKCNRMRNDFKYYLAFENTLCRDYITEKYFDNLKYDNIPVVRGGANYTLYHPYGKIIDAANFESAEKLVEYLKFVSSKESFYSSFSEWKETFESKNYNPWCELCKRIQKQDQYRRLYQDLDIWWRGSHESGVNICYS